MSNLIKKRLKKETPRSLILVIDLCIVSFSYIFSNFLLQSFYGNFEIDEMLYKLPIVIVVYLASFFVFKPYRGVVRQTGIKDAQSIFYSCLTALVFLIVISVFQRLGIIKVNMHLYFRLSYSVVILHFLLTTVIMVASRIFYSKFYKTYVLDSSAIRRILIYGAGDSGIITLNVLQAETKVNAQVFGFIDDNFRKVGKRINGFEVFSPLVLTEEFILRNRIDDIIISIQNINRARLNEISSFLELLPVKIKIIPAASDWLEGKYSSKQIKDLNIDDLLGRKVIELDNPVVDKEVHGQTILITGAAGSIGSEIARQIATRKFEKLILLDQAESALYDIQQTIVSERKEAIVYIVGNIRDQKRMKTIFEEFRPSMVYHAAAYKHVPLMEAFPYEAVFTNIYGTKVIADLAEKYGTEKFVMISTDKAVNPTNVMGATKRVAEIYVSFLNETSETNFIVTRFGNVLGSNGSVIPLFKRQIEKGGPLSVTHQEITRYFMTIPEACQLVLEASVMGHGGEIFVFDMGESIRIFDLAKKMIRLSGYNYPDEINIEITGLRPGEKIYEELLANDENTLKTHHEKIMIAQVRKCNIEDLGRSIEELIAYVRETEIKPNNLELVKRIKNIVPEYKSQNSTYEALDIIKPESLVE